MEKGTMLTTTMIKNVTTELSPILRDKVCHRCIVVFYTNPPPTILPLASGSRPGDKKSETTKTAMGGTRKCARILSDSQNCS